MAKTVDKVNHKAAPDAATARRGTAPAAPDDDVLELVHAVMHLYRSQQYRVLRDGPHEITHMESKVLGYFGHHPGATLTDLVQHSGRDKAQLARLVKGLRDRGLLDAAVDADDRRNVRLALTPAGESVRRTLHEQARRVASDALAGFDRTERRQLQALLARLRDNLARGEDA